MPMDLSEIATTTPGRLSCGGECLYSYPVHVVEDQVLLVRVDRRIDHQGQQLESVRHIHWDDLAQLWVRIHLNHPLRYEICLF